MGLVIRPICNSDRHTILGWDVAGGLLYNQSPIHIVRNTPEHLSETILPQRSLTSRIGAYHSCNLPIKITKGITQRPFGT